MLTKEKRVELSKGFSSNWIEELKSNNDIVSVVSKHVQLQKKGKRWWGCCPFHFEKTPSFTVDEMEQFYHCFGCGASGDVIRFVQNIENCDFYDACKILAENSNMKLPHDSFDVNVVEKKKHKEKMYAVLRDAANYYYNNLKLPQAKKATDYISKRKINPETVKAFGLGYSLGWNEVISFLEKKGHSTEVIQKAGIADEKNGKMYDAYAQRLIFPLLNGYGNVIGFSARLLEDADFAKYKNTRQTEVFDKSRCVYGINLVKKQKKDNTLSEIIVVEGQMDVISLYQEGVKNSVACLGTALTPQHAKELKKIENRIVLCLDGDTAGVKATIRSIEILVDEGLDVYVASMPKGVDPDDFIKQHGKEAFEKIISDAKYWVEFLIRYYAKQYNMAKMEEKTRFVKQAMGVVSKLHSASEKYLYLNLIKEITNISVDVLKNDLHIQDKKETVKASSEPAVEDSHSNAYVKAVKFVLASLLHKKEYAKMSSLIYENLLNADYKNIYKYIDDKKKLGEKVIVSNLFDIFNVENNKPVKDLIDYIFIDNEDNENYYKDCVKTLVVSGLTTKQKELSQKISQAIDAQERKDLITDLSEITKKIININRGEIYD